MWGGQEVKIGYLYFLTSTRLLEMFVAPRKSPSSNQWVFDGKGGHKTQS